MPQHPVEISLLCSHPRSTRTSPRRTQRFLKVCATPRNGRGARARRQVGRMITLYTVTLTVACCVAVALVVVTERRTRTADARWATTSTFAVLAASCATLSSLAYAMSGPDGENLMPLVIGDVSMPLSIGLILAAVRRAAGRKRTLVILSVTLSIAVGATTLLLSPDAGQAVKLLVLAVLSALTALACLRSPLPPLGAWLVGATMSTYGVYCALRFGLPLVIAPTTGTCASRSSAARARSPRRSRWLW